MKTFSCRPAQTLVFFLTSAAFIFLFTGTSLADGQAVFIAKCGSCHGAGKEVRAINPADYAASQWKNYFKRRKHQRKTDISERVPAADHAVILKYLIKYAADSDQPEVAAIP